MIPDYPALISEITHRTDISGVANRASMYVSMAENMLSNLLRLGGMLTAVTLASNDTGEIPLPDDYLEMQQVNANGKTLSHYPVFMIVKKIATGYGIGGNILYSSYPNTDHMLTYFAKIPPLASAANGVNWLLQQQPEIYLYAVMLQIYNAHNDIEKIPVVSQYLGQLIKTANYAAKRAQHAGKNIYLGKENL